MRESRKIMYMGGKSFLYYHAISIIIAISIVNASGLIAGEIENNKENNIDNLKKENSLDPRKGDIWNLHFQMTTVSQGHPSFHADYSGRNSFKTKPELETTITSTLFAGLRLWPGAELYINPELTGGKGMSGATGIAGFPNGETYRVGDPTPVFSLARAYIQQTVRLGDESETIENDANQLPGNIPLHRLKIVVGKFSLPDFFDGNTYSHDPRTQFLNWTLMSSGSWDFAADTRGYTYGFFTEYNNKFWSLRFAFVLEPEEVNGLKMDLHIANAHSYNIEGERRWSLEEKKGALRIMFYRNEARMGNYREAIHDSYWIFPRTPDFYNYRKIVNYDLLKIPLQPDLYWTRHYGRSKNGVGINLEQQLTDELGIFMRGSWNDGANETWAFTEVDWSGSVGILTDCRFWKRRDDHFGIAVVVNGLSNAHKDYLAQGGYGFMLGDGALSYSPEMETEIYYDIKIIPFISLAPDYQFVLHPGYNKARGPAHVIGLRLHVEF